MSRPDPLQLVADRCHWVRDVDGLLARVPDLAHSALAVESWPVGVTGKQWVSPITGVARLGGAVVEAMEKARGSTGDTFIRSRADAAASDVLVAQLGPLLAGVPPRLVHRVVMGIARLSSGLLGQDPRVLLGLEPTVARRARQLKAMLDGLSEHQRAIELGRISDGLSARIAAAIQLSGLTSEGLSRRMIANRLVWVIGHDALKENVPLASAILALPLESTVVSMVQGITKCALDDIRGRSGGRKERPADALVEHTLRGAHGNPLFNVGVGPTLIRMLPHLIEVKALKGRVQEYKQAGRFLEPAAVRTVAGAWDELVQQLGAWDVMSSVVAGIQLVSRTSSGWRIDNNMLDDHVRWSMEIPRAEPRRVHAVVAVRFSDLLSAGGGGEEIRRAISQRWMAMLGDEHSGVWLGDHGLVVFNRSSDAIRFGLRINRDFIGSDGMLPTDTDPVVVSPGLRPAVGLAVGIVVGGTSGSETHLDGPAVSEAIHLSGAGTVIQTMNDPLRIRRVAAGPHGLESTGVAMSRAVMSAATNDWGGAVHRHGDGSNVAGVSRDFESYPVDSWAALSAGAMMFISLGKHRGAAVLEAFEADPHTFKELAVRDEHLQSGEVTASTGLDEGNTGEQLEIIDPEEVEDPFGFEEQHVTASAEVLDTPLAPEPSSTSARRPEGWTDIGFGDDGGSER